MLANGYKFTSLKRFKKIKGLNYNMLSVKSIRIMNRLSSVIQQFSFRY